MSTPELTTIQHVILCALAWRGPQTPYQLKDYIERVINWLWGFPHAQLYTEPPKLAEMGLVTEERELGGRRRKTYTITGAGLEAVKGWLADPPDKPSQLRDLALLKLHFSALSDPDAVRGLALHQIEALNARAELFRAGLASSDEDADRRRYVRSGARLALASTEQWIAFWEDVAADPNRETEARRRSVDGNVEPFPP